jgi:hypothetical protein
LSIFEEEDVVILIVLGLGEVCEELVLEGSAPRGIIVAEVNAENWLWMEEELRKQVHGNEERTCPQLLGIMCDR